MNLNFFIDRLSTNRGVFGGLLKGVSLEQARWKPSPDKWSMLEVINHLFDEEVEDFRARLELVLADPKQPWPPIDPRNWVNTRGYNERGFDKSLNNFFSEREKSLGWLGELAVPVWDNRYEHPDGRFLSAGDLLGSWLAQTFFTSGNWPDFIGSMSAR